MEGKQSLTTKTNNCILCKTLTEHKTLDCGHFCCDECKESLAAFAVAKEIVLKENFAGKETKPICPKCEEAKKKGNVTKEETEKCAKFEMNENDNEKQIEEIKEKMRSA